MAEIVAAEAVGAEFSLSAMLRSSALAMDAVRRIASALRPGMSERTARDLGQQILESMGIERNWHQIIIRFGAGTLETYQVRSDMTRVLGETDIFFVDIGPVWDGHEGDAGDTFVVGDDPEMHACAAAVRELWTAVSDHWRSTGATGQELYRYAAERAQTTGWRLNLDIKGHRVCDFPHAIYRAGDLGDFSLCPSSGLWMLEIQIAHPTRSFGAFYEDLLVRQGTEV